MPKKKRTDWDAKLQALRETRPEEIIPFADYSAANNSPEFEYRYGEKGVEKYRRVFDEDGFDQWNRNAEGFKREDIITPSIDYLEIFERKGKPRIHTTPSIHEDGEGFKVLEAIAADEEGKKVLDDSNKPVTWDTLAKKKGLEAGDKLLVIDRKGNQFWFTYSPRDPDGRRDGSKSIDEEPANKFRPWSPPSMLVS